MNQTPQTPTQAHSDDTPERTEERKPYRAPVLRSTEAFERMALLSCGADSTQPEECDEL